MYEIQVTVIYKRAILVSVTSDYRVKMIMCKTWIGILAKSADPDQAPQTAGITGLNETVISRSGPLSQPTRIENRHSSAVSALISFGALGRQCFVIVTYPGKLHL